MDDLPRDFDSPRPQSKTDGRLESWKEIAGYLQRSIRNVQKLEKEAGLPVYRFPGGAKGTVYSFRPEIDTWLREHRTEDAPVAVTPSAKVHQTATASPHRRWKFALASAAVIAISLILVWNSRTISREASALRNLEPSMQRLITYESPLSSVSPDGRTVAYVDTATRHLCLVDVTDHTRRTLVSQKTREAFVWSRDSKKIAYASDRNGTWDIWIIE